MANAEYLGNKKRQEKKSFRFNLQILNLNFGDGCHTQILVRTRKDSFHPGRIYSRMEGIIPGWKESFQSGNTYTVTFNLIQLKQKRPQQNFEQIFSIKSLFCPLQLSAGGEYQTKLLNFEVFYIWITLCQSFHELVSFDGHTFEDAFHQYQYLL